jgi:hypothetical protein
MGHWAQHLLDELMPRKKEAVILLFFILNHQMGWRNMESSMLTIILFENIYIFRENITPCAFTYYK